MKIDFPTPHQTGQLRRLWNAAFDDEDVFLDAFFSRAFDPSRCRCVTEHGEITSALYWFDTRCGGQHFAYVYAVATAPGFRGRGLCRALIADAKSILKREGYHGILLVPAGEKLAEMYRKMGFSFCTSLQEFSCEAASAPVPMGEIPAEEYARLRRLYLGSTGVVQEGACLAFLDALCRFYAGETWIAAISRDDDSLRCRELLGDVTAAAGIVRTLGCSDGTFRAPGQGLPFAMVCPLTSDCANPSYFAFAFD